MADSYLNIKGELIKLVDLGDGTKALATQLPGGNSTLGNSNEGNTITGNTTTGNTNSGNTISGNEFTGNVAEGLDIDGVGLTGIGISGLTISDTTMSGNTVTGNALNGNTIQGNTMEGIDFSGLLTALKDAVNVQVAGSVVVNETDKVVAANTNIISDYAATKTMQTTLMVAASANGILNLEVDGALNSLNSGTSLDSGKWYAFDIPMLADSLYNLQYTSAATMQIKWIGGC